MGMGEEMYGNTGYDIEDFQGKDGEMKGKIEAVGVKKLPKQISLKIEDTWFGVWLQTKDGTPTDLHWMGALKKGDFLSSFDFSDDGQYKNITKAEKPIMANQPEASASEGDYQRGQREGNINSTVATVFSQVIRFGFFVNEADVLPAWKRYLNTYRKWNGLPPVDDESKDRV